jgi:hypothetical protein
MHHHILFRGHPWSDGFQPPCRNRNPPKQHTFCKNHRPGFDVDYRLPEYTQREILAAAEDFLLKLADAATFAKFQAYSIDATFVTELQTDVTLISGKKGEQTDDRIGDIGGTAETAGQIRKARKLIKALNTSVRNKFRKDPVVLAKWSAASRIHRISSRNPGNPPPAPPAP